MATPGRTWSANVLVALSDTHGTGDPRLTSHLARAIATAEVTLHAGDFNRQPVLLAFEDRANELVAVHGNTDDSSIVDRLPEWLTVEWGGHRFLLTHGHAHDETALSLLARQEAADVVVVGHSHRPVIDTGGGVPVVNPGSHADPRGNEAAYATFERTGESLVVCLRTPAGAVFDTAEL